jgi:hypothetical protein
MHINIVAHPPEAGKKRRKGLGGRRNPLKQLNSTKANQGYPFVAFDRAWLDLARFGKYGIGLERQNGARAALPDAAMTGSAASER